MEEHLKSAQTTHRFFVLASVVVLVFALAAPSNEDFPRMLSVLRILKVTDFQKYRPRVDNALNLELNKRGISQRTIRYGQVKRPIKLSERNFEWGQYDDISSLTRILRSSSLVEINEVVTGAFPVKVFLPDPAHLFGILEASEDLFTRYQKELADGYEIGFSRAVNRPELGYRMMLQWKHPDPSQAVHGIKRFETLGGPNIKGEEHIFPGLDGAKWLRAELGAQNLGDIFGQSWETIRSETVLSAMAILEKINAQSQKSFTVTSLTVPTGFAAIFAPSIIAVLAALLLIQVKRIALLAQSIKYDFDSFPWICLYPDPVARAGSIVSVSVLPVVASFLVVLNISGIGSTQRLLGYLLSLICFAVTVALARAIFQLPLLIEASTAPKENA